MYCAYCGSYISDDATFCSKCGRQQQTAYAMAYNPGPQVNPMETQMAFQTQKNAIRQSEINRLNETINYFMYRKPEFDEYDVVCKKLNEYS